MNDRTFTQDEVNTIVQDRLAKEKAKYEKMISDAESGIKKRERLLDAKEQLQAKGLPLDLVGLVRLDDDDAFNNSLALLEKTFNTNVQGSMGQSSGYDPAMGGVPNPETNIRRAMGLKI